MKKEAVPDIAWCRKVVENAKRLQNDALFLFDAGRERSSIILIISALEECNRIALYLKDPKQRMFFRHEEKLAELQNAFEKIDSALQTAFDRERIAETVLKSTNLDSKAHKESALKVIDFGIETLRELIALANPMKTRSYSIYEDPIDVIRSGRIDPKISLKFVCNLYLNFLSHILPATEKVVVLCERELARARE